MRSVDEVHVDEVRRSVACGVVSVRLVSLRRRSVSPSSAVVGCFGGILRDARLTYFLSTKRLFPSMKRLFSFWSSCREGLSWQRPSTIDRLTDISLWPLRGYSPSPSGPALIRASTKSRFVDQKSRFVDVDKAMCYDRQNVELHVNRASPSRQLCVGPTSIASVSHCM